MQFPIAPLICLIAVAISALGYAFNPGSMNAAAAMFALAMLIFTSFLWLGSQTYK